MYKITNFLSIMLLLLCATAAKAQSQIPGELDLSTTVVDAGTGNLHDGAGWDGSKLDWMTKGNMATIKFENTKDGAKFKILSYGGTNQNQVVVGFSILDSKGNVVYDQTTEPYASGGFTDKKKNASLPVTDALAAGQYELMLYYDNLDEGGSLTVNITKIEFIDADEYVEDEPTPTPGGVGLNVPCDLDLSKAVLTTLAGSTSFHYMADGDENCPRLDYPHPGDVATFKIKASKAMAYKMSFNYATPMDGMFMTWVIKDTNGQVVYNEMFNIDPTGAPGDFWTIYKDFDNSPETPVLPAGDYTFIMYYNVDKQGNIVNGSYDGAENGNFHINIKRITFAVAGAGSTVDIDLSTIDTSASQGNKTLHYMAEGDENCPRLDYPSAGDVGQFKLNLPKESAYKMDFNYATPMDGMFMTWILTNAEGQEVYNKMFNIDPTGAPGDFWTIYKDFDNIPVTDVLPAGQYTLTMKYNIDQQGNIIKGSYDGAENGNFHINIKRITFKAVKESGEDTDERVLYSWEGAEAGATEKGGKAVASDGQSVNYLNGDYWTIRVNKKKADIESENITITLDEPLQADDEIAITAYRNKDTDANGNLYILFDNGTAIDEEGDVKWNNIHAGGGAQQPNTNIYSVGKGAGSKTLKIARSTAGTNVFIIKIEITRGNGNSGNNNEQPADDLPLQTLTIDGVAVDADVRTAINSGDAYTATQSGRIYTALPRVEATNLDGTTPHVTSTLNGTTATYTIEASDRTYTLSVEGIHLYQRGDRDEDYTMVYSTAGKMAYQPEGQWTEGWTDGLYNLRTTNLDGWGNAQFKFNAADNLVEVPAGVVVKTFSLERYGANYGDGQGLTAISSEGASFLVPTKHGFTRGGRDTLTVIVENHQPGAPIAFTLTGGQQPYAQLHLVIEKTNPGNAPKVISQSVNANRNHAVVTVRFDREMSPCTVQFQGREYVSGNGAVLSFGIDGLNYASHYDFTIPAGAAVDMFGNKTAEDITVGIDTGTRQAVQKKTFDYVVGTPEEFTAAIKAIGNSNKTDLERVTIFLKDGDYNFGANNEQRLNRGNVSLIGQSRNGVTIRGVRDGISNPILNLRDREGFYLQDMTLQNDHDFGRNEGVIQAVAVYGGNKTIMKNVRMNGNQDTQVTGERAYFDRCEIHGMVDFICGGGNNFYDQCDLVIENRGGCVIAAPNNSPEWGYVFSGCTIRAAENAPLATNGSYHLGRPWQPVPRIYYINTRMELLPADAGWTSMGTMETHFYEYGSTDKNGNLIDLSVRRNSPTSTNTYTPTITAEEAKRFTVINVLGGTDGWVPTDYTELPAAPQVMLTDGCLISWPDDDQVRCWVIFRDGQYVTNTTDTSYLATNDGIYTIRSANEMGGLSTGEARVAVGVADRINASQHLTPNTQHPTPIHNLAGQRVDANYRGLVISEGRALLQK